MPDARAPRTAAEPRAAGLTRRLVNAGRIALLAGLALAVVGVAGRITDLALMSSTLGPTAYLFVAHPEHETAHLRNATVSQVAAIAAGLVALALMGGLSVAPGRPTLVRMAAGALGLGLTLLVLELVRSRHAPAASTVLLVAVDLVVSARALAGLTLGIAGLLLLVLLLSRVPPFRRRATSPAAEQAPPISLLARPRAGRTAAPSARQRRHRRLLAALHVAWLGAGSLGVVGAAAWLSGVPLVTSALGPTAYTLLARDGGRRGEIRNAVIAHSTAILAGLGALALSRLPAQPGSRELATAVAPGLALAALLLVMELIGSHHAPAGSTAVLVASGLSGPTTPLVGLTIGLAVLVGLALLVDWSQSRGLASPGHRPGWPGRR